MESEGDLEAFNKKITELDLWTKSFKQQRLNANLHILRSEREATTIKQQLMALGLKPNGEPKVDKPRTSNYPPTIVLIGGGMGAGKSTVVEAIGRSNMFSALDRDVVLVEADAFKLSDPMFKINPDDPTIHKHSIDAAAAINLRRDIIFDGTMMWAPYVEQTIDMIRDNKNVYKPGPGYVEHSDGSFTELYWEISHPAPKPMRMYKVWMVGVTVHPQIAVQRGRKTPVRTQLRSHKLFTQNFEKYLSWVDKATLFDNNVVRGDGEDPMIIAAKLQKTGPLLKDADRYREFIQWADLNVNANSAASLLIETPRVKKFIQRRASSSVITPKLEAHTTLLDLVTKRCNHI